MKNITDQAFYEECVLLSYSSAPCGSVFADELQKIGGVCPDTFQELIMKLSVTGCRSIPLKPDFRKWGFKYIKQLLGFAINIRNDEFTGHLFAFMNKPSIKRIIDVKSEKSAGDLYWFYYETITGKYNYREFCEYMADYILRNCKDTSWHKKVIHLSLAFGLPKDVGITELVQMKRETPDYDNIFS